MDIFIYLFICFVQVTFICKMENEKVFLYTAGNSQKPEKYQNRQGASQWKKQSI